MNAAFPFLVHHASHQINQLARAVGPVDPDVRRLLGLVFRDPLSQRSVGKRRVASQQVIERAAEGIDVGAGIDIMAVERLFGRQVVGGAEHIFVMGDGQRRLGFTGEQGQAQIQNLHDTFVVDEQVCGFDITMDQAAFVGVLQTVGCLNDVVRRHREVQKTRRKVLHDRVQVGP